MSCYWRGQNKSSNITFSGHGHEANKNIEYSVSNRYPALGNKMDVGNVAVNDSEI